MTAWFAVVMFLALPALPWLHIKLEHDGDDEIELAVAASAGGTWSAPDTHHHHHHDDSTCPICQQLRINQSHLVLDLSSGLIQVDRVTDHVIVVTASRESYAFLLAPLARGPPSIPFV